MLCRSFVRFLTLSLSGGWMRPAGIYHDHLRVHRPRSSQVVSPRTVRRASIIWWSESTTRMRDPRTSILNGFINLSRVLARIVRGDAPGAPHALTRDYTVSYVRTQLGVELETVQSVCSWESCPQALRCMEFVCASVWSAIATKRLDLCEILV